MMLRALRSQTLKPPIRTNCQVSSVSFDVPMSTGFGESRTHGRRRDVALAFQSRSWTHSSARQESATMALAGAMVAFGAYGSRIVLNAWEAHQQAKYKEMSEQMYRQEQEARDNPKKNAQTQNEKKAENPKTNAESTSADGASGASSSASSEKPFNLDEFLADLGTKVKEFKMPTFSAADVEGLRYYKGGFEEKMTRREAAQILGIR